MESKTILAVCAVACTLLAFGLCVAALAVPIWWEFPNFTIGLFRSCVTFNSFTICVNNSDVSSTFQATRFLVVAASILLFIAIVLGLLLLCLRNSCLAISGCIFSVVAGLCILAAVAITVNDTNDAEVDNLEYGVSFILACVTIVVAIIAGVIFAFAKPKKSGTEGRVIHPI